MPGVSSFELLEKTGIRSVSRTYEPRQSIFHPGQVPDRVYFLLDGVVRTYKEYGFAKEFTTRVLKDEGIFGWSEVPIGPVNKAPANGQNGDHASEVGVRLKGAQAITRAEVASVSGRDLGAALCREPGLSATLIEEAMDGVRASEDAVRRLAYREVTPRLARALHSLTQTFGIQRSDGILLDDPLFSHASLAELTACSREAISKVVGQLREAGIADAGRGGIFVKDPEALVRLADPGPRDGEG